MSAPVCDCGARASLLCDASVPMGMIAAIKSGVRPVPRTKTCDKPLCSSCATKAGSTFVCGKRCEADSIDYCPKHARLLVPHWSPE